MRIWHLTRTLSGGAGQYALRLSNALRAQGFESSLLVSEDAVSDRAVKLRRIDSPIRRFVARGFRSLSHRICLEPFHSIRGPELYETPWPICRGDVVHLHGITGWIGVAGLRKLIPQGAKVFWTAHDVWMLSGGCVVYRGSDEFQRNCANCPILRPPWKSLAVRELRTKEDLVKEYKIRPIANSQWMAARIRESMLYRHVEKIPVIPPIVDDAYFAEDIHDLRSELKIPIDQKVICLGARSLDDKFKGIPEFLDRLSLASGLSRNVTILLFGPGTIHIPANLDVRLLGSISDPKQLARVYRTSDLYVLPSQMETFGLTLAEAQAVGTPVAAFDVGGVSEAVPPAAHARLQSRNNPAQLVSLVASMLGDDASICCEMGSLRRWAQLHFKAPEVARRQASVYDEP